MTAAGRKGSLAGTTLAIAIVATALGLIYSSHICREFYAELQDLETHRWTLQEDYSRLMLEQSTLASPHRVVTIARDDLDMKPPKLDPDRVVVAEAGR